MGPVTQWGQKEGCYDVVPGVGNQSAAKVYYYFTLHNGHTFICTRTCTDTGKAEGASRNHIRETWPRNEYAQQSALLYLLSRQRQATPPAINKGEHLGQTIVPRTVKSRWRHRGLKKRIEPHPPHSGKHQQTQLDTRSTKKTICAKKEVFPYAFNASSHHHHQPQQLKQAKIALIFFDPNMHLWDRLTYQIFFSYILSCSSVQIWNPILEGPRVRSPHRGHQDHDHHPRKEPF